MCIEAHICMYYLMKKRGHGFETEWRGAYGKVWIEEREGRNAVVKIQSQKQTKIVNLLL